jgi:hypothetical protein
MGRTACTEPQCLYKGALYLTVHLYLYSHYGPYALHRASVPVQGCAFLRLISLQCRLMFTDFFTLIYEVMQHLCFLTHFGNKFQCCRRGNYMIPCDYITNVISLYTWLMASQRRHFLLAWHNISAASDRLYQVALNRKLSRQLEKWSKFAYHVKAKSHKKRNWVKRDLAVYYFLFPIVSKWDSCEEMCLL